MAKIKVITFRGFYETDHIADAQRHAKDMILDIMTDGHPADLWWAEIRWYSQKVVRTISCPQIGFWSYTGWNPLLMDSLF